MEPILLLGKEKFAGVDIRVRVKGGGHVSQIYGNYDYELLKFSYFDSVAALYYLGNFEKSRNLGIDQISLEISIFNPKVCEFDKVLISN